MATMYQAKLHGNRLQSQTFNQSILVCAIDGLSPRLPISASTRFAKTFNSSSPRAHTNAPTPKNCLRVSSLPSPSTSLSSVSSVSSSLSSLSSSESVSSLPRSLFSPDGTARSTCPPDRPLSCRKRSYVAADDTRVYADVIALPYEFCHVEVGC